MPSIFLQVQVVGYNCYCIIVEIIMVSRKKAKGKARRAAKAKKIEAEAEAIEGEGEVTANGVHLRLNDAQMIISNGAASLKCHHGLVPLHRRQSHEEFLTASNNVTYSQGFLHRFVRAYDAAAGNFLEAYHATKEEHPEVWNDPEKMKFVVSYLITSGTSKVLEGEGHTKSASKYASLASYFEQYMEVDFLHTRPHPNWPKIRELYFSE